jgi:acyl-CoA thioester hydrolase
MSAVSPPATLTLAASPEFILSMRVYWEDTDAGGVVYYANYLKFFERARTEWLRKLGFGQQVQVEQTGAMFVVADARVRYLSPARLDDWLDITVRPQLAGRATLTLNQQARLGQQVLCDGEIQVACVDRQSFRPRRIPSEILSRLPS